MNIRINTGDWLMSRADEIKAKYYEFNTKHPDAWSMFETFAMELIYKGVRKYSSDSILHRIRWEMTLSKPNEKPYKINNNFSSLFARTFISRYPQYEYFFETRRLKSEEGVNEE
jgi:hypothetical protein